MPTSRTRASAHRTLGRLAAAGAAAVLLGAGFTASANASTVDYVMEDDFATSRVDGLWADASGGGSFAVGEFSGASAMRLGIASSSSRVYLYDTYPAGSRPTDVNALRAGASYTYAGANVNFQIEMIFLPSDPAFGPGMPSTPCDSANNWGFTDVPSTWCYTVIKWEPLATAADWTTVDLTADTPVDSSQGVGGWRNSKRVGVWPGTGAFAGSGTFSQYLAQIAEYQVVGTAFGVGSGTAGPTAGWVRDITFGGATTQFGVAPAIPTTTSLVASASSVTVGTSVTLTATVAPSAAGQVAFTDGTTTLGTVAVETGTATLAVTPALGSTNYSATFTPTDPASYLGSTSAAVTVGATPVPTPAPPAAPPATSTEDLQDVLADNNVDVEASTQSFSIDGGAPGEGTSSISSTTPFDAELPWSAEDDFVDVYAYSTPVFIGTFPVVNGVVQLSGVDLSAVGAGDHHLVFLGQSSGAITAVTVTVAAADTPSAPAAPVLPATGLESQTPLAFGVVLLTLGLLLLVRRRATGA